MHVSEHEAEVFVFVFDHSEWRFKIDRRCLCKTVFGLLCSSKYTWYGSGGSRKGKVGILSFFFHMGTAKIPIASGFTAMSTRRWGGDGIVTARLRFSDWSVALLLVYRKRAR